LDHLETSGEGFDRVPDTFCAPATFLPLKAGEERMDLNAGRNR
jgi:hypothetical protein